MNGQVGRKVGRQLYTTPKSHTDVDLVFLLLLQLDGFLECVQSCCCNWMGFQSVFSLVVAIGWAFRVCLVLLLLLQLDGFLECVQSCCCCCNWMGFQSVFFPFLVWWLSRGKIQELQKKSVCFCCCCCCFFPFFCLIANFSQ